MDDSSSVPADFGHCAAYGLALVVFLYTGAQSNSEDVPLSMLGLACQDVRVVWRLNIPVRGSITILCHTFGRPLQVGVGYTVRDYCDGQSLASPGRWSVAARRYPETEAWRDVFGSLHSSTARRSYSRISRSAGLKKCLSLLRRWHNSKSRLLKCCKDEDCRFRD